VVIPRLRKQLAAARSPASAIRGVGGMEIFI